MSAPPIAARVYVGETEAEFWRRKALERSERIAELERTVKNLRDAIAVHEEERGLSSFPDEV